VFESCSIACADGNIDVQFRYWVTAGVTLRVCTRDAFFGDTDALANCHNVQTSKQSGLAKATVPGGQLITLDVVATSFTSDTGSVAIVDRINVSFKACPIGGHTTPKPQTTGAASTGAQTTTVPPTANDDLSINCPALRCTFDQDTMCGFKEYRLIRSSAAETAATKGFAVRRGRFDNLLTGATEPKDGGAYAAAYLYAQDSVSLQSDLFKISEPRILHFNGYIAAQGVRIKVCLDNDNNCPFISSSDVKIPDRRKWKSFNILLPKGTKQVFIVAENTGFNQGAVALDNIDLLRPVAGGPLDAEQSEGSACDKPPSRS